MSIRSYNKSLFPFESKWLKIGGNDVHYIDEGMGEVILFCHPPISSSFMYRHLIKSLAKNFRCVSPDFPGFGLSRAHAGYSPSIESQAEIVEQLLKTLQLHSVYLVMQEVGGHSAMSVFLKYPQWLKGIILTDTIIFPVSQYPKISRMLNIVDGGIFNFFNSNFNVLIRMLTSSAVKKRKMNNEEKETYKAMFNSKRARRESTAMLHQLAESETLLSLIQQAFETDFNNMPALLIYGDEDSLTKLGVPQRIHKMLPNSELHWIQGEKHFPHEGAPGEMSQIISSWVKRHRRVDVERG